tara:strand:- start:940 stop:2589 length:1650 start_codon:yes stop_codon:yes gene_type:complete
MFSSLSLTRILIDLKDPIAHGSVLMKKKSLIDAGGYNESFEFSQDYELWFRLLSMGKRIECVDYVGYYHRLLPHVNKIKINAQRRYASMITDYYANNKGRPNLELPDFRNILISERKFQQANKKFILQKFFYWCNIGRIQLKALLKNYSIFSQRFNTINQSGVLMITGVYHPEISGAANQCRQLVNALSGKINFKILTTTQNPNLSLRSQIDGVEVFRVLLKKRKSLGSYCKAVLKFTAFFLSRRRDFQIVHLHGFSLKSTLVVILSKIFHKKIIIKMTSVGHDDPVAMMQRGFLLNYFFSRADVYMEMTPHIKGLYYQSRLPSNRLKQIPNGVDTDRFCPVTNQAKVKLRNQLGLPEKIKLILFVGHFSREKCPDILLNTWMETIEKTFPESGIVFIGSTNPDHYEVDTDMVKEVKRLAKTYQGKQVFFVERTHETEKYYQAADIFVMPSLREGLPNTMLEAMSCELPVIVSELKGVTDWVVEDEGNGLLFEPRNKDELGKVLLRVLKDHTLAHELGAKARTIVIDRFSMMRVTEQYFELYRGLIPLV